MAAQKSVARLATLYGMIERMRSVELSIAAGAVQDAACAAAIASTTRAGHIDNGRSAMATGQREEWQVAETSRGVVETRIVRLATVRKECEGTLLDAEVRHHASRMDMERMHRVVEVARTRAAMREDRRAQSESDDRFASRRAWMQARQSKVRK